MKLIVGVLAVAALSTVLGGCSGSRAKSTQTPNDVFGVMDKELSQTVSNNDSLDVMRDELSHAIGTTSLTSEVLLTPMLLPEDRMSLSEVDKPASVTWGAETAALDLSEIPDTRE